jgi:mono/diheme cytochrome c family protein
MTSCGDSISSARMESGRKVYQKSCEGCHMDNGGGVPNMNAPLIGSVYVSGDKEKLISIVLKGSAAFADDSDRPYKNLMGPMSNLTDTEIADVLTYLRNNFNNKGPAISAAEVQSVRGKNN